MTGLVFAGEAPPRGERALPRLRAWREALTGLGMVASDEPLELADPSSALAQDRVVVVVREQLDHLNALYCQAVLGLQTYADFDSYVLQLVDSGRHDLTDELGPLLDASGTDVVVVPFSRLGDDEPRVGPVLVTGTRLLHKRMARLRLVDKARDGVVDAAHRLRERAASRSWDTQPYWGWTPSLADEAVTRFRSGNAELAQRVWGTDWPDLPPQRERTRLDLAGQPPEVVHDVLVTIRDSIDSLQDGDDPEADEGDEVDEADEADEEQDL